MKSGFFFDVPDMSDLRCTHGRRSQLVVDARNSLKKTLDERFQIDASSVFCLSLDIADSDFFCRVPPPFYTPAVAIYLRHFWQLDTDPGQASYRHGFNMELQHAAIAVRDASLQDGHRRDRMMRRTEDALLTILDRQVTRLFVVYELTRTLSQDDFTSRDLVRTASAKALLKARTGRGADDLMFDYWLFHKWLPQHLRYGFEQATPR